MQQININELKPHPRNNEFFDDINGEKWDELLDSIRKRIKDGKRGNIEPIIINLCCSKAYRFDYSFWSSTCTSF